MLAFLTSACGLCAAEPALSTPVTYEDGRLNNGIVSVQFEEEGTFSIHDAKNGEALLSDSRFGLTQGKRGKIVEMSAEDVEDAHGSGKRVVLKVADFNELGYWGRPGRLYANRIYTYALYENQPALVCGFGLSMPSYLSLRLMEGTPLAGGRLFGGREIKQPMTLNGSAGMDKTLVTPGLDRRSLNSLMLTGLVAGERRSAVWGGLGNEAFGKFTILQDGSPSFYAQDPIGRLVDEEETYIPKDTFYIDVHTRDPFEASERYGLAMRKANKASPNVYDFPVLCGWSVGKLSKLPNVNNSAKLIGELEHANKCGLTKYTKGSLRLEPDKYHRDTEQGWWDDAHMREFKHLVEPYESIAKWSQGMKAKNGIPYIYMQLGMPSDDFVRKYPHWMLFNDGSEVDKTTPEWVPGRNRRQKHNHHQPYVTYDYTDKEFSKHFVKVWSKLREDGIRGVKVDYPATAFSLFTPEITRDFSRIYPHYPEPKTARPLDAFTGVTDPQVYDLELTPDWHQIALYNTSEQKAEVSTAISGQRADNAIGLDPAAHYHAYEFWSDTYLGKLPGTARIARELQPNHCAMISVRKVLTHPQVLSTNRHILQGWVEMKNVRWDPESRTLAGTASVIGGEPFEIVVANNGAKPLKLEADGGEIELKAHTVAGLNRLTLSVAANTELKWRLKYE